MTTATREAPHHNTTTCYTEYRCRRPDCVERYNARNRERLRAHKAGTFQAFIDAEPVRQHILQLQAADVSVSSIAMTAGLPVQSVLEFINTQPSKRRGRKQRTSPETAAKILAVSVDNLVSLSVDATGTRRRIQALVAIGWPMKRIAVQAGLSPASMSDLLRRRRIFTSTAKAIATTYNELHTRRPEKRGVPSPQAKRARNWAARERWAPPKYWERAGFDLIDDPDFVPAYGVLRAEIVAQDAHWLITTGGLDRDQVADRLGVSRFYVDSALREHPQGDRASYGEAA